MAQELASIKDYDMLDLKYDSNGEGSFTKEGYEKLQRIIQRQDAKSKEMQTFFNKSKQAMNSLNEQLQNARQAYKKLEKDIRGDANLKKVQELQEELNTLQAAANIITTPIRGRQKLKLRLKDEVKDEIIKIDHPKDFLQYAKLTIKINN
ncbi:hypothetical protein COL922a_004272 [Colletotrichum nupharicola]|nr:hypothetical protein COL922a_004272 [Colletotrichum nupharicola]